MLSRVRHHGCTTRAADVSNGWGAAVVARTQQTDGSFSSPRVVVPCTIELLGLRTSYGAAFACAREGVLVAFGSRVGLGIVQHTVPLDGSVLGAPVPVLSANWRLSNCFDASGGRSTGACRYDSKLTLLSWRGKLWLFVRANVYMPGGRHVQVSQRVWLDATAVGNWSRLRTLRFEGYTTKKKNNIYFFPVVVGSDDRLYSLFPAVIEGVGAIFSSWSSDGVHWSRPLVLVESRVVGKRTVDYQVLVPGSTSRFYIQHNVCERAPKNRKRREAWSHEARPAAREPPIMCRVSPLRIAAHEDNAIQLPPGKVADDCHLTPVDVWPTTLCAYKTADGASWHAIAEASAPRGVQIMRAAEAPLPRMFRTSLMYHANGSAFGRRRSRNREEPSDLSPRTARAVISEAPSCTRGWVE